MVCTKSAGSTLTNSVMTGWDRLAHSAMLPYILHLWAVASSKQPCEVVTHFPTLAGGLAWENPPCCCVLAHDPMCLYDSRTPTKRAFSLPQCSHVPVFNTLRFDSSRLIRAVKLHAAEFAPWQILSTGLVTWMHIKCHNIQFYAIALPNTKGSLMILVSLWAREKRLSVQECKFTK